VSRHTLKACICGRCSAAYTIISPEGWRPSEPLCEDCDYADFLDEHREQAADAKRREREFG
tara:strand:- start:61868 stop:62050 length:183 start_codon:yes stop_codon:yes gene_type:complete